MFRRDGDGTFYVYRRHDGLIYKTFSVKGHLGRSYDQLLQQAHQDAQAFCLKLNGNPSPDLPAIDGTP